MQEFIKNSDTQLGDALLMTLTRRERLILQAIVHNYILNANPVGSRMLAKRYNLKLSPATIRNTMSDLEQMGLLTHQHTSAGRLPTDLGYRLYVDDLMLVDNLKSEVRENIEKQISTISLESHGVLDKISSLLSEVSKLLSVITLPDMTDGILEKVELIHASNDRIIAIVIIKSGNVRTINLELQSSITKNEIVEASRIINQRLAGVKLAAIPREIHHRLSGVESNKNTLIRLFLDFPEQIFTDDTNENLQIGGARKVLDQPEYQTPERLRGIIELIEDKEVIVHLLKDREDGVTVTIGNENEVDKLKNLSIITSTYKVGGHSGTLGIIGPTRMNYSRLVSLVDYTSKLVTQRAEEESNRNL